MMKAGKATGWAQRPALWFWVVIAMYAAHAAFAIAAHRHLFGDAAWFLVRIASEGRVTHFYSDFASDFYYSRVVAYWVTQFPTVAVAHLGLGDWRLLSWVLGATYFGHKIASLLICWWILPESKKYLVVFPVLGLFAGTVSSDIYVVTEIHIATSFYWPLLLAISQRKDPGAGFFVACAILLLAAAFTYESMAFLAPLLIVSALLRRAESQAAKLRASWAMVALAGCIPFVINVAAILFPRDPANKSAFTYGLKALLDSTLSGPVSWDIGPMVSILALAIFAGAALVYRYQERRLERLLLAGVLAALLLAPLLHFMAFAKSVDFSNAIDDRGFAGLLVQFGLAMVYMLAWRFQFARLQGNLQIVLPLALALAAGQLAWQAMATHSWSVAFAHSRNALKSGTGEIVCDAASMRSDSAGRFVASPDGVICRWWALPISVLQAPDGRAEALLRSMEGFTPFDMRNRETFPAMTYAPVDFEPYFQALADDRDLGLGERVTFRRGGAGTSMLRAGFSGPEDWATWTDGKAARLDVCSSAFQSSGGVVLEFEAMPFVTRQRPQLAVQVSIDGSAVTTWRFQERGERTPKIVQVRPEGPLKPCLEVAFSFDSDPPANTVGAPDDPRRLGLALLSLTLRSGDSSGASAR